jgi:hypothetical protein
MCNIPIEPNNSIDLLDIAFKSATVCIAIFNAFFAVKIFRMRDRKDDTEKERDRKIQLLKTLVLDHNLQHFYKIFDEIEIQLCSLKKPNLTNDEKQEIDINIGDLFIKLRRKFYDSLISIDITLYESIGKYADELQTHFTNTIFDQGINLSHSPKYDELIQEVMINTKSEIIKKLFNYRG